ncbi:uncharacterized protein LOC134749568 [Cydia strobilella]|uniref:uncharacterized protein LOC134749568 n=1 Tax=Cydia strobilella TaxID=1100964 RepID=UPI003005039C
MASDLPAKEINGINLENYYPSQRSCNSVSYIHKKFFNNSKETVPGVSQNTDKTDLKIIDRMKKTRHKISKQNKANKTDKDIDETSVCNEEVLGQTIRFAKNIVPIVIPPSANNRSPVYYTIKTSRKSRLRNNKSGDYPVTQDSKTYRKQQEKKIIETFRKENFKSQTESFSHESISRSSIENIVISQSLNSSVSALSARKVRKTRLNDKRLNRSHVAASESLEAVATELLQTSGEAKIKIQLMDDTAKDLFYESIRKPVIEAIRESVAEIMHSKEEESKTVHRYVQCHSQKLDNILDKLACIEKRLDGAEEKVKIRKGRCKGSALEEIGEDISKENEDSEDEMAFVYGAEEKRKGRCASGIVRLNPLQKIEEVSPCSGDGEVIRQKAIAPTLSSRPDKIPTRYCWTDSTNQ